MNRKVMIILFVLLSAFLTSCGNEEYTGGFDEPMDVNIITSEENIKTIDLDTVEATFTLEDILDEPAEEALLMGRFGEVRAIEGGYFQNSGQSIDYITEENEKVEDIVGIIIEPPSLSITKAYYHMKEEMEKGKVMFLLLDGFGYHQYEYAKEKGYIPFLENQEALKALGVYKPVTNAGLGAIITGKTPEENGVYSREQRELRTDSIFKIALDSGKNTKYIEGNIGILNTEIQPILNLDENKNGYTDDEVFASILKAIEENTSFIFGHFHGIDDANHTYGPLSEVAMKRVKTIDTYIEEIANIWDGTIIISADHGAHTTEDGGDHGEFRYEDLIVPYIIINRGN